MLPDVCHEEQGLLTLLNMSCITALLEHCIFIIDHLGEEQQRLRIMKPVGIILMRKLLCKKYSKHQTRWSSSENCFDRSKMYWKKRKTKIGFGLESPCNTTLAGDIFHSSYKVFGQKERGPIDVNEERKSIHLASYSSVQQKDQGFVVVEALPINFLST